MFRFGADYYPEHWSEERWAEDVHLMAEAGFNVVRLAEFAWSRMELTEGRFDFAWLDRAIALLHDNGIDVVLGTPTASPPPWLMAKQEELFLVKEDGVRLKYGNRREYCPNNPFYHDHTRQIVQAMADHYKDNPAVIGWQIDNEFGSRCYCEICRGEFHNWLHARYDSLEDLNTKWGTEFWSHIYTEWSQIPTPVNVGNSPNPGLGLDYARFMSDSYRAYQKMQIDLLRETCPDHFITHNLMGFGYPLLNYYDMTEDLDFVTWDDYWRYQWNMVEAVDPSAHSLAHDTMRGLKKQNFWVMEQQSGSGGWEMVGVAPKPGELRLWTYESIAHGADGIVYFRWRTCRTGTEQYWHGILDHHGIPGRRYDEVAQVGCEVKRINELVTKSEVRAQVAIMQSYDTRFAFQIQGNNPRFSYEGHVQDVYRGFYNQNIPIDIISENDPLTGYKVVVVPAMYVLPEATAATLETFAEAGGVVVFTPRTGVKDDVNAIVNMKLPGLVAKMAGVEVEEYISMPTDKDNEIDFMGQKFAATTWADVLQPQDAEVVAHYQGDFYAGRPAITFQQFGEGKTIYVGTIGGSDLNDAIAKWVLEAAEIAPLLSPPAGVEVATRWHGNQQLVFVLNHSSAAQRVQLDQAYHDILSDKSFDATAEVAPYDVLILTAN
ncbi:beta-galactosidase [Chloroflexota bacterium]